MNEKLVCEASRVKDAFERTNRSRKGKRVISIFSI